MGAVKARAYADLVYTNYDIKSCHTVGLKQVAEKLAEVGVEIDVSAWEEYDGKYAVAERTGLSVALVKIVEHGIKYGAYLPTSIARAHKVFEGTPIDPEKDLKLVKAARKHAEDPDEALSKLYDEFADMRRVVKDISETLLNEYWEAHKQSGGPAGWCMKNACGVPFRPSDYREGHERRTKVMAWMLQGLEAAYIHSITILSAESDDFSVVANEHDGLNAEGEIPEEAQEVARLMSGFHRAELAQKPHADQDEIEELYGEYEEQDEQQQESALDRAKRRADEWDARREITDLSREEVERMRSRRDPVPSDEVVARANRDEERGTMPSDMPGAARPS